MFCSVHCSSLVRFEYWLVIFDLLRDYLYLSYMDSYYLLTYNTWRWRQYASPKRWWTSACLSVITFKKILLVIITAARQSDTASLNNIRREYNNILWAKICSSHCAVAAYCSNELWSVSRLHVRKLCSRSRNSEQSFVSVYRVYSLHNYNMLKYGIPCEGDSLRLTVCACYAWEMVLHVGLDVSFGKMQDWKGIGRKQEKLIVRKVI
jgi:hypothetical protein